LDTAECIIAGGGAIGLAIARALALRGREVLVIERNGDFGLETSGRNSEVIHAGIYYRPDSLKARLCREGHAMLLDYLAANDVPHEICGKLIVATTTSQFPRLAGIEANARDNGVTSLERLDRVSVEQMEPDLACVGGLLSPRTGIFDSRAYMRALLNDIEAENGSIAFRTSVLSVRAYGDGYVVETADADGRRYALRSACFVNAAGLQASELARHIEVRSGWTAPQTKFARGTYYRAEGKAAFRHLVYPVPVHGGLGIHLTLDLQGSMRFGPDIEWIDRVDYSLHDTRSGHFRKAISSYWPGVAERELHPAYCGVRPKIVGQGEPDGDFLIAGPEMHGMPGMVQLFGIESPGLTSSLAIAEHVASLVE
jgi:L-2-hydroxyglutarate oxidase LhgO